jgi:hypothetical protein
MQLSIRTPNPLDAFLRGVAVSCLLVGSLWALRLPLDPTITLILFAVGTCSAFYFYDGSFLERPRRVSESDIIMRNIFWDFSVDASPDITEFITQVHEQQSGHTDWSPEQAIPCQGPVEIQLVQYDTDDDAEQTFVLSPSKGAAWSHALLLYAIHHYLHDNKILGHSTFFEGLIQQPNNSFRLILGS